MDYDALLNLGTELGYKLVLSGAEIYRVEESVLRLLTATWTAGCQLSHCQCQYTGRASDHTDAACPAPRNRY